MLPWRGSPPPRRRPRFDATGLVSLASVTSAKETSNLRRLGSCLLGVPRQGDVQVSTRRVLSPWRRSPPPRRLSIFDASGLVSLPSVTPPRRLPIFDATGLVSLASVTPPRRLFIFDATGLVSLASVTPAKETSKFRHDGSCLLGVGQPAKETF